jgi:hypothetical protein
MAAAPLWPYSAGILFLICKSEKSADFSDLLFHGRGRNGKRHMLLSACGRRAATWIFCMEPNRFGIIKGVQPLIRASRASKVAGAFLVLFWHTKENVPGGDVSCKKAKSLPHTTTFCPGSGYASSFAATSRATSMTLSMS